MSGEIERKLRVLLLTDQLCIGGLQRIVVDLANELNARGHVVIVAAGPEGPLWEQLSPEIGKMRLNRPEGPLTIPATARIVRRLVMQSNVDVVHAHQRGIALSARIGLVGTGVPLIEHVHNTFTPADHRLTSFRGDMLIACGPSVQQMLLHDYRRKPGKVKLITNGVIAQRGASASGLPPICQGERALSIVAVGRLSKQKDPMRFVRVISALERQGNKIHATWVGGGELKDDVLELARELKVSNLEVVGPVEDVGPYLARADLFMLTSRWEGLPLAALEALAFGRPPILPETGSCKEAVKHGNGVAYPVGATPEDIAKLVSEIGVDDLVKWSSASRKLFLEEFDFSRVVDQVANLYVDTISRLTEARRG